MAGYALPAIPPYAQCQGRVASCAVFLSFTTPSFTSSTASSSRVWIMPPEASWMRSPSIPSMVPTCLPSEPFTSIISLICRAFTMALCLPDAPRGHAQTRNIPSWSCGHAAHSFEPTTGVGAGFRDGAGTGPCHGRHSSSQRIGQHLVGNGCRRVVAGVQARDGRQLHQVGADDVAGGNAGLAHGG